MTGFYSDKEEALLMDFINKAAESNPESQAVLLELAILKDKSKAYVEV